MRNLDERIGLATSPDPETAVKRVNAILVNGHPSRRPGAFLEEIRDDLSRLPPQTPSKCCPAHDWSLCLIPCLEATDLPKKMQFQRPWNVLDRLYEKNVDAEAGSDSLKKFYASVGGVRDWHGGG